jgi:hypothetical protein
MIRFAREYDGSPILQQAVAKLQPPGTEDIKVPQAVAKISGEDAWSILQQLVAKIRWGHNILLMEKIKDLPVRLWYMQQVVKQDWKRDVLLSMIKNRAHERQGKAVHNFEARLPASQSELAHQPSKILIFSIFRSEVGAPTMKGKN